MTFDEETLARMREQLRTVGMTILVDQNKKRIVLTSGTFLGWGPSIMVSYEGQGCAVYEVDRPMNPMRLIKDGFKLAAAQAVSELLNQVVGTVPASGVEAKAIESAKAVKGNP